MTVKPKTLKSQPYRLAHFSDFHIGDEQGLKMALEMVRDAVSQKIDHILITGDLLDCAELHLAKRFWAVIKRMGWATSDKCTFVPGNHDIFPFSANFGLGQDRSALLKTAIQMCKLRPSTRTRDQLARLTMHARQGAVSLCRTSDFAVGKVLGSGSVVIASADSSSTSPWPWLWQTGELSEDVRKGISRFFKQHSGAKHHLLAFHHSPRETDPAEVQGPFNQLFDDPKPADVRAWIRKSGASFVFCGHIHQADDIDLWPCCPNCQVFRAGASGGWLDGNRVYHLVAFYPDGKVAIRRRYL